jgi:hypothetical protein
MKPRPTPSSDTHDPNLHLLTALPEPPADPRVRLDYVRAMLMHHACATLRMWHALKWADEDRLKSILLTFTVPECRDPNDDTLDRALRKHDRAVLKLVTQEQADPQHALRKHFWELAGDILSWQTGDAESEADEFQRYVRPAWWVFTDEIEYKTEGLEHLEREGLTARDLRWRRGGRDELACWRWLNDGYSQDEANRLSRADARHFGRPHLVPRPATRASRHATRSVDTLSGQDANSPHVLERQERDE